MATLENLESLTRKRTHANKETAVTTIALSEATFNDTMKNNDIVLIDFWAEWCGPCRAFGPVYEKVSENHEGVVFGKVDTEAEQALAGAFQISSIPTLLAVRDSVVLFSQAGALPESELEKLIQAVKDADMDQVHADVAKENAKHSADDH
jgi:thioredoxin 1